MSGRQSKSDSTAVDSTINFNIGSPSGKDGDGSTNNVLNPDFLEKHHAEVNTGSCVVHFICLCTIILALLCKKSVFV